MAPWQDILIDPNYKFKTLIMDEVHELRHTDTQKRRLCFQISETVDYCLGLSGTPIYNQGNEIYSVLDVIRPGCLASLDEFESEWCSWGKVYEPATLNHFLKHQGLMLRRTPSECGLKFGEASKHIYTIDSDLDKLKEIENIAKLLALSVLSGNVGEDSESAREFDWKLRHATGVAKARPVAEFVKMLVEQGEKVVLAGWHRDCFIANTKVLMYDGTVKSIQDIKIHDLLMGPDSRPRKVLSAFSDYGETIKIIPKKGVSFVCSSGHLITTEYNTSKRKIIKHSPAREFLSITPKKLQNHLLMRSEEIDFPTSEKLIEPWLIGFWIGDGAKNLKDLRVASADEEVWQEMRAIAGRYNLILREWASPGFTGKSKCKQLCLSSRTHLGKKNRNGLLSYFRNLNLNGNTIPDIVKTSRIEDRKLVLAGLIDSDGHMYKNACGADYTSISKTLAEDVAYICRSLGLAAYVIEKPPSKTGYGSNKKNYFRVQISGDLTGIPTIIDRKRAVKRTINKRVNRVGFNIEPCHQQTYYGIEVDGDNLFLLSDFTIVHNCYDIWLKELENIKPVMYTGSETTREKDEAVKAFVEGDAKVFIISLRSGSGLDGLQKVCSTVVFGELDWSPHVMDQVLARLDRDGQTEHVQGYYLTIADGADPFMIQVLSGKRSQHDGLIEGKQSEVEIVNNKDSNRVRDMAKAYLTSIGEEIPESVPEVGLLGKVINLVRTLKLPTNTEEEMQEALYEALKVPFPNTEREFKVTKRSRLDFMIGDETEKVAIECKIDSTQKAEVYRQVRRYAEEGGITSLILVAPWQGIGAFKIDNIPVLVVDTNINAI